MEDELLNQIKELQCVHDGLILVRKSASETVLSGLLNFEASVDGYETISSRFEIDLIVPIDYPETLPCVRETSKKIDSNYDHINSDGTLCLAIPIEERRVFSEQPSLLGFINRLLIPYCYGYCYWEKYQIHPFGEAEHGFKGIVHFYMNSLQLKDEVSVLSVISYLYEHGYRGHHRCPCGSGQIVRKCHGKLLRSLIEQHSTRTLKNDFLSILIYCSEKNEREVIKIPERLHRQILRILQTAQKQCR